MIYPEPLEAVNDLPRAPRGGGGCQLLYTLIIIYNRSLSLVAEITGN